MEQIFNKLVRDNIPDKIKNNGEEAITRTLTDEEFKKELLKKLLEEANEVVSSTTREEQLEEIADVYEVLSSLTYLNNSSLEEIESLALKKKNKNGGFSKKIFLIKTK